MKIILPSQLLREKQWVSTFVLNAFKVPRACISQIYWEFVPFSYETHPEGSIDILRVLRNGLVQKFIFIYSFFVLFLFEQFRGENNFYLTKTRLNLSLTCLNWKIYLPDRVFKPSIYTLFGKIIHFICLLKLRNNFISF